MRVFRSLFLITIILNLGTLTALDSSVDRPQIQPADLQNVHIQDGFWAPRIRKNRKVTVQAVPYYSWSNREPGAMQVWVRRD